MRKSMRKSLDRVKRASSKVFKSKEDGPEDNKIVRYSGVSVQFLRELKQELVEEKVASGVELCVLTEDTTVMTTLGKQVRLGTGSTLRVKKKLKNGTLKCRMQYIGAFDLTQDAPLEPKPREKWTIEDVCEYVVLEETRDEKLFYLELMEEKDVGKRFQGAFLSQARKSCFCDLVTSLVLYYEAKGSALEKQFVWFDVFCANQPLLTTRDEDLAEEVQLSREGLLKVGLHDAISKFEDRLIYFNSWLDPYPIQRAWCVWEIFGCVKSEKSLDILFQPGEENVFVETLMQDREKITQNIMDIRLEDAECFVERDKQDIDAAVEEQVGYHRLNVTISALVQKWLKLFAVRVLKEKRKQDGTSLEYANTLCEVGIFFRRQLSLQDEALKIFEECLRLRQRNGSSVSIAFVLNEIAAVYQAKGDYDAAREKLKQVMNIYATEFRGTNHGMYGGVYFSFASISQAKGEYDSALDSFKQALRMFQLAEDRETNAASKRHHSLNVATTLGSIASILLLKGEVDAALEKLKEVLHLKEELWGSRDHPYVASTLHEIARCHQAKGDYDLALEQLEEVLRIVEKAYGGRNHPAVTNALHEIAVLLEDKGDYDGALEQYRQVLALDEKMHGGLYHPKILMTLSCVASVLQSKGEYDQALEQIEEALAISQVLFGTTANVKAAIIIHEHGKVLLAKGEYDAALARFQEELGIFEKAYGTKDHPYVASALHEIARCRLAKGDGEAARKQLEEVLRSFERIHKGHPHPAVAATLITLAECLNSLGLARMAREKLEQAKDILGAKPDKEYQCRLIATQGVCSRLESVLVQSRAELEQALNMRLTVLGQSPKHVRVQDTRFELIKTLVALGAREESIHHFESLLATRLEMYPSGHPRITELSATRPKW